jgi:hypothetical protein
LGERDFIPIVAKYSFYHSPNRLVVFHDQNFPYRLVVSYGQNFSRSATLTAFSTTLRTRYSDAGRYM